MPGTVKFIYDHNDDFKAVTLENAHKNLKFTSSDIQKNIVRASAEETLGFIMEDIRSEFFSILVDESKDISL